jgi:hypothetical protein
VTPRFESASTDLELVVSKQAKLESSVATMQVSLSALRSDVETSLDAVQTRLNIIMEQNPRILAVMTLQVVGMASSAKGGS